jgi:hypothetical protein
VRPDCYISADIEADGPIPGPHSMLSFGFVVAGSFDGTTFAPADLDRPRTFYRELRPISDGVDEKALAISGLDRERLVAEGEDPRAAMDAAHAWVVEVADGRRPVLVAYPLAYDWMWLYWYFVRFAAAGSPFGFSGCLDVKTMIATKLGVPADRANKDSLPAELRPDRPHTHHAVDDAIEQAELFARLFTWTGPPGAPGA